MNGTIHDCHGYTYTDPGASAYVCPGARTHTYVLENMMVTIPGVYVAWKIILTLLFTLLLGWVVKEIHTFISYSKSRAKPIVTMQFFKLLLLLVATILRWVWLLDPHQTSKVWPARCSGRTKRPGTW